MGRSIRFSFKRFLFHNKISVLLTLLVLAIILILRLQTTDTQSNINNLLKTFHEQYPYSKAELDAYYKFELGIVSSNVTDNVDCENVWMIAAIPGIDIEDYMWEYLSLLAIDELYGEKDGRKIKTFLSKRSIKELENIFNRINFTDLGTVPDRCYRLNEAILVENGNSIYFKSNTQVKSVFLLGEGERRYKEIAESDEYRKYFRLNERYKRMALSEISNFKTQLEIMTEVPVVGMYIRTLELPSTYYERAMDFIRKIHYGSIFVVICPPYLMIRCQDKFRREDTVVMKQHSLALELAILAMCNHTVIENEFGILGGLINENMGDSIIYDRMHNELEWFSKYMTENFENWYSIA